MLEDATIPYYIAVNCERITMCHSKLWIQYMFGDRWPVSKHLIFLICYATLLYFDIFKVHDEKVFHGLIRWCKFVNYSACNSYRYNQSNG